MFGLGKSYTDQIVGGNPEHRRIGTRIQVRKWAIQMAAGLTDNERNAMGGIIAAAEKIEAFALEPLPLAELAAKE